MCSSGLRPLARLWIMTVFSRDFIPFAISTSDLGTLRT